MLHCEESVCAYSYDLIVGSSSMEEYHRYVELGFGHLDEYIAVINPRNCQFGQDETKLLCRLVTREGIRALPNEMSSINDFTIKIRDAKESSFCLWYIFNHVSFQTAPH